IILTRGKDVAVDGENVEVIPLESPLGQHRLMRSGTILIKQNRDSSAVYPVSPALHNLIHLGLDLPVVRTGYTSTSDHQSLTRMARQQNDYRAVISSSKVDTLATTAAFYPLTFHQIWNTGLPRNDFILCPQEELPEDFAAELARLRMRLGRMRLVLLMPACHGSRESQPCCWSDSEVVRLAEWLQVNDCMLGIRHQPGQLHPSADRLGELPVLDLSDSEFIHLEVLYREAAALITDHSSNAFVDFMLTGRPVISWSAAGPSHTRSEHNLYDLDLCFPGPVCIDFNSLRSALEEHIDTSPDELYEFRRRIFFDRADAGNSARVVEKIRDLTAVHGIGKWSGEHVA
ncbi:MAG: CDP-glycerol glycerophosphotransferase family protein, partial [Microlunatus sp.]